MKKKIPLSAKKIAIIMAIICLASFLYKFTVAIAKSSSFVVNTNIVATTIADELKALINS